eukprot:scaffold1365_cov121-Isochrysis_galbana.AAC.5
MHCASLLSTMPMWSTFGTVCSRKPPLVSLPHSPILAAVSPCAASRAAASATIGSESGGGPSGGSKLPSARTISSSEHNPSGDVYSLRASPTVSDTAGGHEARGISAWGARAVDW